VSVEFCWVYFVFAGSAGAEMQADSRADGKSHLSLVTVVDPEETPMSLSGSPPLTSHVMSTDKAKDVAASSSVHVAVTSSAAAAAAVTTSTLQSPPPPAARLAEY